MSGASVCVLVLNGRRQTVKCSPNTTILQILEEVCKKQNLNPNEYDLKHHNKILDTTTIFRFSGLPNNAQIELVTATKIRSESDITLAVNLENGNRLMGTFTPNDTLLNILSQLCPESLAADKNPVVIYTRREMYGKDLENVTLRSLGITGGRAMIRLLNRSPEELKVQAAVAAPLPSKPTEEKPFHRILQRIPSPSRNQTEHNTDHESKAKRNKNVQKGGTNIDIAKVVKEKRKSKELGSPPLKEEKKKSLMKSKKEDTKVKKQCECKRDESMEVDCCGKCEEKCTNVAPKLTDDDFMFLGDRNAMLFSLETAQSVPSEDLPDDFFELTIDDARKILRDVKKQRYSMDNTPLMTSTLRNLEESKKQLQQLSKYKRAIIRIQFPDRTVLQGTFRPTDTIKEVCEFVSEYLEQKSMNFYLYSTPPKCVLAEDKNLLELSFVPGAMVHFGTDTENKKVNILRKDLRDKFTSNSVASLAANRIRVENMRACKVYKEEDDDVDMEDSPDAGASTSTGITHDYSGQRKIVKSTDNVPKWFRPS